MKKILSSLLVYFLASTSTIAHADNYAYGSSYQGSKPSASNVRTDTDNFNGNLSAADNTVQAALDTLDNMSAGSGDITSVVAGDGLTGGATSGAATLDVVGTADRITVGANAVDIASTYVGQATITTLGTITTGTWNGTALTATYLGTDSVSADELSATGVEAELEAVIDLQDLQGAVTDTQVPNTITIDVATLASTVTVADASSDTTTFPMLSGDATGSKAVLTDTGITYNATTDALTATTFVGALTGNASGTAATVTGATQTAITSAANLATVGTITSGVWNAGAVTSSGAVQGTSFQIDTNTTGVSLDTDGDGMLIEAGTGNGNDEDLRWNFDDGVGGANSVELTSGTGVTDLDITAINLRQGENTSIVLDPVLSADGKYCGVTEVVTAGETIAFGDVVYLKAADSQWYLTDADADATAGAVRIAVAVTSGTDNNTFTILTYGKVRADANFPTLTVGAPAYISTTAGDVQTAQPSGTDDVIRIVGYGNTGDELFVCPSNDYITHT